MDAKTFLLDQLDDASYQLTQAFDGISEPLMDTRLAEQTMTPREMIAHLAECYQAFLTTAEGGQHAWGEWQAPDLATSPLKATCLELRNKAIEVLRQSADDSLLKTAHLYILAHDYYHVGQIVTTRANLDPEWNPNSIYR